MTPAIAVVLISALMCVTVIASIVIGLTFENPERIKEIRDALRPDDKREDYR